MGISREIGAAWQAENLNFIICPANLTLQRMRWQRQNDSNVALGIRAQLWNLRKGRLYFIDSTKRELVGTLGLIIEFTLFLDNCWTIKNTSLRL